MLLESVNLFHVGTLGALARTETNCVLYLLFYALRLHRYGESPFLNEQHIHQQYLATKTCQIKILPIMLSFSTTFFTLTLTPKMVDTHLIHAFITFGCALSRFWKIVFFRPF